MAFTAKIRLYFRHTHTQVIIESHQSQLQNVIAAPYLVQNALAGVAEFLDTKSAGRLRNILQISNDPNVANNFHSFFGALSNDHALKMVNAEYVSVGYHIQAAYQQRMTQQYSQVIMPNINFSTNDTSLNIDAYVAGQTNRQITTVVLPGDLNEQKDFVIVTVASFAGNFQKPFSPFLTKRGSFNMQKWNPIVMPTLHWA